MTTSTDITHQTYEDAAVVAGYIQKNRVSKQKDTLEAFAATLEPGSRVLDLGCGPGQNSYLFARLGFQVVGFDYSQEMINQAKKLETVKNMPRFIVGDMRQLEKYFPENSFNAVWASASLLHLKPDEMPTVLASINSIVEPGGKVFISLKGGVGTHLVTEDHYAAHHQREFTLWTKDEILKYTTNLGWSLKKFNRRSGRQFRAKPTEWLEFEFATTQ